MVEAGSSAITNFSEATLRVYTIPLFHCLGSDIRTEMLEILADMESDALSLVQARHFYLILKQKSSR